jgi:Rrf2 family protein
MKVDYGVRALVDLAQSGTSRPVQTADIAARQGIPESYLNQVLTILHKASLIKSRRGPHGGHVLARDPSNITLAMIMNVLEGNTHILDCLVEPDGCMHSQACAQREIWSSFEESVEKLLSSTTISDMTKRQKELTANRLSVSL